MSVNKSNSLIITISDSAGHTINTDLSPLLSIGTDTSLQIISALKKFCSSYNTLAAAKKLRTLLKSLGTYYTQRPTDLNDKNSLYSFLFDFRAHWYTTSSISQRLDTRNAYWDVFVQFAKFLMDEDVIPSVSIPPGNAKLHNKDILARSALTNHNKKDLGIDEDDECITSLVPISLARSDEDYLDELELNFKVARDVFLACARKEINEIKESMSEGDRLIQSVDYNMLSVDVDNSLKSNKPYHVRFPVQVSRIRNGINKTTISNRNVGLFSRNHPDGYMNILARVRNEHDGYMRDRDNHANFHDPALFYLLALVPSANTFSAHIGLLTNRTAIPFFVYLVLKNPRFNVESLANIEVEGKDGVNRFLSTCGEDSTIVRVKVQKGRANAEKSEIFDEESKEVLQLLLRLTAPFRKYLKKMGDANYNKLWLCGGPSGIGYPYHLNIELIRNHFGQRAYRSDDINLDKASAGIAKRSFLAIHPELKSYVNNANLARLRVTAGLIQWFESGGDAKAVARALGNSVKVAVDHYIPRPLQVLMNKRMVRRFQNLLIVSATAGETYMLRATDFRSVEDLHLFLSQMLNNDRASGNDLLAELQRRNCRTASTPIDSCDVVIDNKNIAIKISAENLAFLFLYEEHIDKTGLTPSAKIYADNATHTTPIFWSELSRLLRLAIPQETSRRELSLIYVNALEKVEEMRSSLKFPTLLAA